MMIRLQNFYDHPTQKQYTVFQFHRMEMADFFEAQLQTAGIEYEKATEDGLPRKFLFGVHKRNIQEARTINNLTMGKFRSKFIPNRYFRIFMLLLTFTVITLGLLGFIHEMLQKP